MSDVPGLEDVQEDADPADPEGADELLEGLLGAQAAEREDVPTSTDIEADSDDIDPPQRIELRTRQPVGGLPVL